MFSSHYNDVIMGTIASQITSLTIVYSIVIQTQIKENIKAPRHWPLCGEVTGDRWIPHTNGQLRGKCFHLMTSSWRSSVWLHQWWDNGMIAWKSSLEPVNNIGKIKSLQNVPLHLQKTREVPNKPYLISQYLFIHNTSCNYQTNLRKTTIP